jgi:hypothetical protein
MIRLLFRRILFYPTSQQTYYGLLIPFFLCLLFAAEGVAQHQSFPDEVSVSVFNNAIALPFTGKAGVLHSPVHPGFTAAIGNQLNRSLRHQLFLNLKLAYLYQKRAQHGLQLYPVLGYRFTMDNGIGIESGLGLGYMHAFTDLQQYKLNENGVYKKVPNIGRPSFLASLNIGLSYDLQRKKDIPIRLFSLYQLWFQTPFVKSYVPVLPNAALHVGSAFYLSRKSN